MTSKSTLASYIKEKQAHNSRSLMRFEWSRFESYANFPKGQENVSFITLAKNGFHYQGFGTVVVCFWCGFLFDDWKSDTPYWTLHRTVKPDCPFLSNANESDNVPINAIYTNDGQYDVKKCEDEAHNKMREATETHYYDMETVKRMEEENQLLNDILTCKICIDRKASIVFLPCGHVVSCVGCAHALRKCPMCRVRINGQVNALMQ
ncbi:hypothetical protein DPMN_054688 [Dreissena polymorpha]|uniref:RING-type domain-containing protein n=1 Tax=Dreissena polymorpha TaxID=45954 RepID=A0A9D4HPZ9_DREPO|nr:hypothetical protein DPMN_054688 [Dreissena polymorpha]